MTQCVEGSGGRRHPRRPSGSPLSSDYAARPRARPGGARGTGVGPCLDQLAERLLRSRRGCTGGRATTHVAADARVDLRIRGARDRAQQRNGAHHLCRLAVPASRDVERAPRPLHGLRLRAFQAFDRGHRLAFDFRNWRDARALRLDIDVHRARAALRDAASILGSRQLELIAKHPQERRIGIDIDFVSPIVDGQRSHRSLAVKRSI